MVVYSLETLIVLFGIGLGIGFLLSFVSYTKAKESNHKMFLYRFFSISFIAIEIAYIYDFFFVGTLSPLYIFPGGFLAGWIVAFWISMKE